MIATDKRYSEEEVRHLREQGYEFKDFTLLTDSCPMYVVSGYNPIREEPRQPHWYTDRLGQAI